MRTLGIDTSNYTTSAAVFDGTEGYNAGRLLNVRPGELGLRQSDALFQHVKALPERFQELKEAGWLENLAAVRVSDRPRAVEGSYMPCFLAGDSLGHGLVVASGFPISRGIWRRRPGPPGTRNFWTAPCWPGTCPAARQSFCMWNQRASMWQPVGSVAPAIFQPGS